MIAKVLKKYWAALLVVAAITFMLPACNRDKGSTTTMQREAPTTPAPIATTQSVNEPDACDLVLAPHTATGRLDQEIIRLQTKVRDGRNAFQSLERLGWMYVTKARESFDPGYYKLAEQCALCLESRQPHCAEALLLRGHVLQNLHKFKEAEALALELVALRGRSFDYGLLGDVVMEQGRLGEAAEAYQRMVDEKPDMQAYARIAHLRWLKGDLAGATEIMQVAANAASPNAPEAAAWVNTRLGLLKFQTANPAEALQACDVALDYQKDYAPALLLRGRLLLADGRTSEAVEVLQNAVRLNPLPEYQWVLSEALRAADRADDATAVEEKLVRQGAATDPRTFALYLASRAGSLRTALDLAKTELSVRADVFTHDTLAWALAANGEIEEAREEMSRALAEGTKEARLFFHATVVAAKAGQNEQARGWLDKAVPMMPLLLPSEQRQLQTTAEELGLAEIGEAGSMPKTTSLFTPGN